ncbi:hypothetical protein SB861_40785 [Paraburkholderia sp. SIMBA_049]
MDERASSIFQYIRGEIDSVVTRSGTEAHFRQYVERYRTPRWGIFSDYVIGDRDRPSDTFVFTVAPLGMHLSGLFALALGKSTPDLKDVKSIPQQMRGILDDARFYSFCFSLKKGDGLPFDRQQIGDGLRELARTLKLQGAPGDTFAKNLSEALSKVRANSFSTKLFSDILFTASIVSYLVCLISRTSPLRPDRIGWFSDRDRITSAYGELVKHLIALEVPSACSENFEGWRGPVVGVNAQGPGQLWCDGILRVPDYLAGTLSVLCFESETMSTEASKFVDMLQNVMAGERSIRVFRASLNPAVTLREMIFEPLKA